MSENIYRDKDQLSTIKQQLDEMVEQKWTPFCQEQDREPLDVWRTETDVRVGRVKPTPGTLLKTDVMRTLKSGYQDVYRSPIDEAGREFVEVTPLTEEEFYEFPDGADVRRAALLSTLKETGVTIPHVDGTNRLGVYETRDEAERVVAMLEAPLNTNYENMAGESLKGMDIREYTERRDWLPTESFYEIIIRFG